VQTFAMQNRYKHAYRIREEVT